MPGGGAVDLGGQLRAQFNAARCVGLDIAKRRDRSFKHRQRIVETALVDQVQRLEIAAQAQLDAVERRDARGFGEQPVGFGKLAQIRFLQRAVDRIFMAQLVARRAASRHAGLGVQPLLQYVEKRRCLGIVARIVAAITFAQRLTRVECTRLHARKGLWVADARGRHRDIAGHDPVGDHGAQPQCQRAVISGQPLCQPACIALGHLIDAVTDIAACNAAVAHRYVAKTLDGLRHGGCATDLLGAPLGDPRARILARAQLVKLADGAGGIAAHDRPGAVEHSLDRGIGAVVLDAAEDPRTAAEAKAVLKAGAGRLG